MQQPSSVAAPRVVFCSALESVMVNCAFSKAYHPHCIVYRLKKISQKSLSLFLFLTVIESAKYYAVVTGVANGQDIYYSTNSIPFNKKAEKYPTNISSPVTGQSLPYNFSMTMAKVPEANRVVWNASKRAAYAKYLGVDLTGYDVHHIIPREYGGTNDYSNLIPLAVSDHRTVTSWWVNY